MLPLLVVGGKARQVTAIGSAGSKILILLQDGAIGLIRET